MQEIGFRNIDVKCKEMRFEFDSVEAMKSEYLFSINSKIFHN